MISSAIIFIVLGVLVHYFKIYLLITGYNTMSKKEKAEINVMKLAHFFGNGMFGMAFVMLLGYFEKPEIENYFIVGSFF